jgi:hypothetical protein
MCRDSGESENLPEFGFSTDNFGLGFLPKAIFPLYPEGVEMFDNRMLPVGRIS